MTPRRLRDLALVCVLTAAVLWVYGGILSSLVRQWASDDNYSHGFFVVPLALYFAWERRADLKAAPLEPSAAGIVVVAISLAVLIAGLLGAELFLTRISLLGVLAGTVLYVWGRGHFRILAFPLAFLALMIPLPAIIFNQIAFPLQLLASRAGELVIGLAGIPVVREGNVLQLPSRTLEVAEACSGIRSLVSLVMVGPRKEQAAEPLSPRRCGNRQDAARRVDAAVERKLTQQKHIVHVASCDDAAGGEDADGDGQIER